MSIEHFGMLLSLSRKKYYVNWQDMIGILCHIKYVSQLGYHYLINTKLSKQNNNPIFVKFFEMLTCFDSLL